MTDTEKIARLIEAAEIMARALQRGPFETEDNFALRREMAFAKYQALKHD
jgi:hypothetical protein